MGRADKRPFPSLWLLSFLEEGNESCCPYYILHVCWPFYWSCHNWVSKSSFVFFVPLYMVPWSCVMDAIESLISLRIWVMFLSHVYFTPLCFSPFFVSYLILFCFVLSRPFTVEAGLNCLVFLRCQITFESEAWKYPFWEHECGLLVCESHCRIATVRLVGGISKCLYP